MVSRKRESHIKARHLTVTSLVLHRGAGELYSCYISKKSMNENTKEVLNRSGYICKRYLLFVSFFLFFTLLQSNVYCINLPDDSGVNQSVAKDNTAIDGERLAENPSVTAPAVPKSPASEELTDIIDIKPPVSYGWNSRWIIFLLLALAAILAAIAVLLIWKKRRSSKTGEPSIPAEPEDVTALAALSELAAADNIQDRVFYFSLSSIIRAYLDGRFGLDTMEKTTEELLPVIKKLQVEAGLKSALAELLRSADPVKFASVQAGRARRSQDLEFVEGFIKTTRRVVKDGNV